MIPDVDIISNSENIPGFVCINIIADISDANKCAFSSSSIFPYDFTGANILSWIICYITADDILVSNIGPYYGFTKSTKGGEGITSFIKLSSNYITGPWVSFSPVKYITMLAYCALDGDDGITVPAPVTTE